MKPVNVLVFALAGVPRVLAGLVQRDELIPIVRSNIPLVRTRDGRYGVTVNMVSKQHCNLGVYPPIGIFSA